MIYLYIIINIRSSVDRDRSIQSKFRSFDLAVLPADNSQFFACTDLASTSPFLSACSEGRIVFCNVRLYVCLSVITKFSGHHPMVERVDVFGNRTARCTGGDKTSLKF